MKYADAHTDAARFELTREMRDVSVVARFTVDGEPISKARARFTSYGSRVRSYTPERTQEGEALVRAAFLRSAPRHRVDARSTFGVTCLFFTGTRQRRDVDNMVKLICDGLNGIAWTDDDQVVEISARKQMELPEHARTEVLVYLVGHSPALAKRQCAHCGDAFDVYPSTRKRFCTPQCAVAARRTRPREVPCPVCGTVFTPAKRVKHCSKSCGAKAARARRREAEASIGRGLAQAAAGETRPIEDVMPLDGDDSPRTAP